MKKLIKELFSKKFKVIKDSETYKIHSELRNKTLYITGINENKEVAIGFKKNESYVCYLNPNDFTEKNN